MRSNCWVGAISGPILSEEEWRHQTQREEVALVHTGVGPRFAGMFRGELGLRAVRRAPGSYRAQREPAVDSHAPRILVSGV